MTTFVLRSTHHMPAAIITCTTARRCYRMSFFICLYQMSVVVSGCQWLLYHCCVPAHALFGKSPVLPCTASCAFPVLSRAFLGSFLLPLAIFAMQVAHIFHFFHTAMLALVETSIFVLALYTSPESRKHRDEPNSSKPFPLY